MQPDLLVISILAVGLSLASLFGYIAQRLKLSPLVGYLLAGYLMGPHFPGFVANLYISEQLAYIGVTLLMFAVGLHFSWKDLFAVKKIVLPGALILALLSIALGYSLSLSLGESARAGLIVGAAICVSSTVVIVKVLSDQGLLHTIQGHIVVGWTIVEDLIAIFVLILLPTLTQAAPPGEGTWITFLYSLGFVILKIIGLAIIVYFLGERCIKWLLKHVARTRSHELFTLVILSVVFVIAIGASYIFGVSLALGAFIAGTVVGKTDVSQQAAANALPMRDAFAVIFFLSVGMLFNPVVLMDNLPFFFGVLFIILILRTVLGFFIVRLMKYPVAIALTVAIAIGQIGEYSFILVEEGSRLKILPDVAYDIIVACSLISIALNPILFRIFKPLVSKHVPSPLKDLSIEAEMFKISGSEEPINLKAIVVGYDAVGQAAVNCLKEHGYNVLIIDRNLDKITQLKKSNYQALFGDATQPQLMEIADLENTQLIAITVPEYKVTKEIILTVQQLNPYIKIFARIRSKSGLKHFKDIAIPIVCDEDSSSKDIVDLIFNYISSRAELNYGEKE